MLRASVVAALVVVSSPALAKWQLQGSPSMAAVEAKAPAHRIAARLQIECLQSSPWAKLSLAVALDQNIPKVGAVGWTIQIDDGETWRSQARRFLETTHIPLEEGFIERLPTAKRFRLTLQPTVGDELAYDFDVSGAADAVKKLDCPVRPYS